MPRRAPARPVPSGYSGGRLGSTLRESRALNGTPAPGDDSALEAVRPPVLSPCSLPRRDDRSSLLSEVNPRLESRMREIRLSGSEGGGALIRSPYPYIKPSHSATQPRLTPAKAQVHNSSDGLGQGMPDGRSRVRRALVALAALSVCALAHAQSAAARHNSTAAQGPKASPSADGKPAPASKPDVAGKVELRDIRPQPGPAASSLVLKNTGPVSTEDVVRGVAKELAKQDAGDANGETASPSAKGPGGTQGTMKVSTQAPSPNQEPAAASDAVMEFHPAPAGTGSSAGVVHDGAQSKSPLKHVHGDLYGVAGADGHAAGGSVGATSKSGKTSVYVQSDQARSKVGQPQ